MLVRVGWWPSSSSLHCLSSMMRTHKSIIFIYPLGTIQLISFNYCDNWLKHIVVVVLANNNCEEPTLSNHKKSAISSPPSGNVITDSRYYSTRNWLSNLTAQLKKFCHIHHIINKYIIMYQTDRPLKKSIFKTNLQPDQSIPHLIRLSTILIFSKWKRTTLEVFSILFSKLWKRVENLFKK